MWVELLLIAGALANTESTVFVSKKRPGVDGIAKDIELRGKLSPGEIWAAPFNEDGRYFAKVCWPASLPADLDISFNGSFILIEKRDSVYLSLGDSEPWTEFTLLVSSFKWGIPQDVLDILPSIILALCTGLYLSRAELF